MRSVCARRWSAEQPVRRAHPPLRYPDPAHAIRGRPGRSAAHRRAGPASEETHAVLAPCVLASAVAAQGIEQIRDRLREAVVTDRYAALMASMIDLSNDGELSSATIRFRSDPTLELSTIRRPWRDTFDLGDDGGPDLYVEGSAGFSGPGAAVTELITAGILFDHHSSTLTHGGALRLDYGTPQSVDLTSIVRHDLRQTQAPESTYVA